MKLQNVKWELKNEFLKQVANEYGFFQKTREVFLARFADKDAASKNTEIAKFLGMDDQEFQDYLGDICEKLGFSSSGRGRSPKGESPWEKAFTWLWNKKFVDVSQLDPSATNSESEPTLLIHCQVCQRMLEEKRRLTTNPLTSGGGTTFDQKDIYVPLGLVERKQQPKRGGDTPPERGSQLYKPTEYEVTRKFEHNEFFEKVLGKGESPKSKGKRIAIIGEPGAGKTTLLQQIADWVFAVGAGSPVSSQSSQGMDKPAPTQDVAIRGSLVEAGSPASSQSSQGMDKPAPTQDVAIWVSLADLQGRTLEEYLLQVWLKDALKTARVTPEMEDALVELFNRGGVWLLLDGVDEMTVENPLHAIASQIRGWVKSARVVLSCRLNVWDASKNALEAFDVYRNLDFSDAQVGEFIRKWFASDSRHCEGREAISAASHEKSELGERLRTELDKPGKERIRDLVKNPLRLTLLCWFWQGRQGELPDTKAGLYRRFVEVFYEWKDWKPDPFPTKSAAQEALNEALGRLAVQAIEQSSSRFRLTRRQVCEVLGEPDAPLFQLAMQLSWLNQVGVAEEDPNEPVYAFYHPTFQEYFAALSVDDWDYFFPRAHDNQNPRPVRDTYRIFEPQWKEVFLLWMGRKDIAPKHKEELINKLIEVNNACRGFYWFRAYFLAAAGIAEFSEFIDSSLADKIVTQIVNWSLAWDVGEDWENVDTVHHLFILGGVFKCVQVGARKALLETVRCRVLTELKKRMQPYQNASLRLIAAKTLGSIAPENCESAIKTLINLLDSSQNEYFSPHDVSSSLIHLGYNAAINSSVVDAVIELLNTSKNENAHSNIADILGYIGTGSTQAIKALIQLVQRSKDQETFLTAVESLGKIADGDSDAINLLIELSLDTSQDSSVRRYSLKSLGKIGTANSKVIKALKQLLDNEKCEFMRTDVAASLGKLDPEDLTVMNILITRACPTRKIEFWYNLSDWSFQKIYTGNHNAIKAIIERLHSMQHKNIRCRLIKLLGKIGAGNSEAIAAIIDLLHSPGEDTRCQAAESLGEIGNGHQNAITGLIKLLKISENQQTRQQAAESLGKIGAGNQEAINTLIDLLHNSPDEGTLQQAAQSLGKIGAGNSKVIAVLINLLDKSLDKATRWQAANSIGKIAVGDPDAIHALSILLGNSKDKYVSQLVAHCLAEIAHGNSDATNAMIENLLQGNPSAHFKSLVFSLLNNMQDDQFQVAVEKFKNCLIKNVYNCDCEQYVACYQVVWHCAANMTYPDFYKAWDRDSEHPTVQALENQLIDIASQLPPTDKTYPIVINAQALEGDTDKCEIAQAFCNRIYQDLFPDDPEILPEVSNAFQLERSLSQIKKQLQKQNLALILDKCEPNEALVAFCRKLTDILHIGWITKAPLEPPLRGFPPEQPNLLSAIQSWIEEIE